MSTIKSSSANLTLNADGANNDIKFQSNGVEKASIDQDGKVTAGGASLDGAVTINDTGADVDFRVESDTDANALFVQGSSGKVGFGLEPTMGQVNIKTTGTFTTAYTDANGTGISMYSTDTAGDGVYGPAITWGALGGVNSHQAAISSVQTGSDANQVGLSMFTHNSTTGSAAMTEAIRVAHGGVMSVPNGIELGSGLDATAANTLDDYEEGSWNPNYEGSSGSVGSGDVSEWTGYYTKIGRLVTVQFKITLTNNGSWGGEVRLTGLPFTPNETMPHAGSCETAYVNYSGGSVGNIGIYITSSQTYFRPRYTHDNSAAGMIQCSEVADNGGFKGMFTYTTDS